MTDETKKKISNTRIQKRRLLGYLNSPETRRRISEASKGRTPWNKGRVGVQQSTRRGVPLAAETKEKIRLTLLGRQLPPEHRLNISRALSGKTTWNKGVPHSKETKKKIGDSHRGSKSHWWIADRAKLARHDKRGDFANVAWREAVKNRDGRKCRIGNKNCQGQLEVHHILRWSEFPELRYEIGNGITLCHYHHPRKRVDEDRLSPRFKDLIENEVI